MYALFFHRLSILERATDHKCINNCSYSKEVWVGFKCNGPVNFFSERRYFKPPTGVFSLEKGDPSDMTGAAGIYDGSGP
jgi:hypothetical protein